MRYKGIISYDGSNYLGSQIQNNLPTIQYYIERALKNMTMQKVKTFFASRTDKGVHAKGQVFHFDFDVKIDSKTFVKGINKRLPLDIKLLKITKVKDDFHARHSAKSKIYEYLISKKETNPFNFRYKVYFGELDTSKMKEIIPYICGIHDFTGFSKTSKNEDRNPIKNLYDITLLETKNNIKLIYHGDKFLRYMIRSITSFLILVGKSERNIDDLNNLFITFDRKIAGQTAPSNGLYLKKILYK